MAKTIWFPILKWLVSLSLLTWLYLSIDWPAFLALLTQANPVFLILGLLLTVLNTLLCAYKWKLFLRADQLDQGLGYLFISYWIGSFVSLFLPSNIGGDSYRIVDVGARTRQGVRSFTSVFADRLTGFIALSIIGLIGGALGYARIQRIEVILILLAFAALLTVLLILTLDPRWMRLFLRLSRLNRIAAVEKAHLSFSETLRAYGHQPGVLVQTLLLSFAFHWIYITIVYCYSHFLGLDLDYLNVVLFIPIIAIFEALPISVYGIGVRDTAYVFFFSLAGLPAEQALALSFVFVVSNVLYASLGGIWLLMRRGQTATR